MNGHLKHGHNTMAGKSPTYSSWGHMIQRCTNPNHKHWHHYGGRGISVCVRWREFKVFLADMGECPIGQTIDRINTNGNYEPGNCKWATRGEQQNNRRDNVVLEHNGVKRTVTGWAKFLGIKKITLDFRIRRGWTVQRALGTKIDSRHTLPRGVSR